MMRSVDTLSEASEPVAHPLSLHDLPAELLALIANKLSAPDLARLRHVSPPFRPICLEIMERQLAEVARRPKIKACDDAFVLVDNFYKERVKGTGTVTAFGLCGLAYNVERVALTLADSGKSTFGLFVPEVGYLPLYQSIENFEHSDTFSPTSPPVLRFCSGFLSQAARTLQELYSTPKPVKSFIGTHTIPLVNTRGLQQGEIRYEVKHCACEPPTNPPTDPYQCHHRSLAILDVLVYCGDLCQPVLKRRS
ncbi:hypothetical protein DFJ77DRAFT_465289 [Powellomyces hirtus]|nr:hypothetical protein DFJ77DRAFT_465289 [Powellomyces hirtus]